MWSLSVEEQFYFVWPLLLVLSSLAWLGIRRRSGGPQPRFGVVIVILATVAGLSFAGSVLETSRSATLDYYSLATRAWELAAGALGALSLSLASRLEKHVAGILTWTGVACIATAGTSGTGRC
ncbi:MAG: acyltransferase family protein [Solirubrobacteraceae bacterium]